MKVSLLEVRDAIKRFVCKIETENITVKFKIDKNALPHILGL